MIVDSTMHHYTMNTVLEHLDTPRLNRLPEIVGAVITIVNTGCRTNSVE
jgi:hypothetical protein